MKLSRQLYAMDLSDGWKGVYSPFGHGIAFIFEDAWENLQCGQFNLVNHAIIDYLVEKNILVEDGFEEDWLRRNFRQPRIKLNSMFMVITQECNLACRYCVVEENIKEPLRHKDRMSVHVASLAVDLFERHLCYAQPQDARVTFYGGEPLLNKEVIYSVVPKIKAIRYPNQTAPVEIVMITNGYLYDDEITELFKKYNVGVCVSIDGEKRHHDASRLTRSNAKPTFDEAIKNYKNYQKAGLSMGISCALGRHNAFELPEIAVYFAKELKARFVEFQIPYQVSGDRNPLWVSTVEIADYLMDAYNVLRWYGIVEGTTFRRLRDFMSGRIHYTDCGAPGTQLVVAPDGMIGPCHSLVGSRTFYTSNVADPDCDPTKLENFNEWAKRFPLNMPICHSCSFISICGGGCPYNSFVSNGSIWEKDPQVCTYMQKMIEWILRDIWIKTGMAAKHGIKMDEKPVEMG